MLRFFRYNDPSRLLIILLITLLLGIKTEMEFPTVTLPELKGILVGEMMGDGKRLYSEVWDPMPPIIAFAQYLADVFFGRSILPRHMINWTFIFFQSVFFGVLLINIRAFNENSYLPTLLFSLLCFFSFDTVSFTGEIIGSTMLLLAVRNLLMEMEFKKQSDETIHNLGFYLGLASLCVFSYSVFFIGATALLFLFARVEARRFALYVFGFLLPHLLIGFWYFWKGELDLLLANFYWANLEFNVRPLVNNHTLLILGLMPGVYFLMSLIMLRRDARLTKYQSQISQVMFFWLLFGLMEVYLTRQRTPQSFLVCVPSVTYFINHYLLLIRRKWIAEAMLWIFVSGSVVVESLSVRKKIPSVDFSTLVSVQPKDGDRKGKKILVLDGPLTEYINNKPSGFFIDWNLARPVFEEPNYYQHVLMVSRSFEKDPPDIIYDPHKLMPGVMKYIPELQTQYQQGKGIYVRIK